MKNQLILAVLLSVIGQCTATAQRLSVESMFGNRNYWYQHVLNEPIGDSSDWQFFHTSSFQVSYEPSEFEVMSQSFVQYKLTRRWKVGLGTFFTHVGGFNPSVAMQYGLKTKHLLLVVAPRADLRTSPNGEVMMLFEWKSKRFYFRFQLMENAGANGHNRGYQLARIGLRRRQLTYGAGFNLDTYGRYFTSYLNAGFFLRYESVQ